MQHVAELERQLKSLDDSIAMKQLNIEKIGGECEEAKKKAGELGVRYAKEFGESKKEQVVLDNKCRQCFNYRNEKHYKNISFDHFSDILHKEIMVYLRWLKLKLAPWKQKAERIINEVIETIKNVYPEATVNVVGSYYTGFYVPWSNFNFNVVAIDHSGTKIKPEEALDILSNEFGRKLDMLSQIK